jgi:hypothetical protein
MYGCCWCCCWWRDADEGVLGENEDEDWRRCCCWRREVGDEGEKVAAAMASIVRAGRRWRVCRGVVERARVADGEGVVCAKRGVVEDEEYGRRRCWWCC